MKYIFALLLVVLLSLNVLAYAEPPPMSSDVAVVLDMDLGFQVELEMTANAPPVAIELSDSTSLTIPTTLQLTGSPLLTFT